MSDRVERRLTVIVSADVVGYARLIRGDEAGTRAAFNAHRRELIDLKLIEHHGRLVGTAGDSLLAEFTSVVDAVEWAAEVQRGMAERNASLPEDRRIVFRIGVNLGDVIIEGGDIHGDGVNVAARLQSLAEPGGICIAANVFEQVRHRLNLGFEDLGEQQVKNIADPVRAYRVLLAPDAAGKLVAAKLARPRGVFGRRRWAMPVAAVVVAFGIAAGVLLTLEPWVPRVEAADRAKMAYPLPEKPSIAIMPFENLSGDPEQDYLADGITDTIITTLSQTEQLFVIARNSTFAYKGRPVAPKEVAEAFGVGNVLEGSFQKSGDQVRIAARLVDALTGRQLWAGRYDRPNNDILALQDDITSNIVEELEVKLTVGEQARLWRKKVRSPEAYQLLLKARSLFFSYTPDGTEKARLLAEQAIEIAPEYAQAYVMLGWALHNQFLNGWAKDPAQTHSRAREAAEKAAALDDALPDSHGLLAWIHSLNGRHDVALEEADKAVKLEPVGADLAAIYCSVLVQAAYPSEAIESFSRARRLDPNLAAPSFWCLSEALRQLGRFDEMIPLAKSITEKNPDYWWEYPRLVYAYVEMGQMDEAKKWLHKMLDGHPDRVQAWLLGVSPLPPEPHEKFVSALVKAGFPMPDTHIGK